ncbi:MAG: TIGR00730 family Rossman fold protein, partial [Rhizobacter sp.]
FQDMDFLLREDLRPVRFQLELLKPDLEQQAMGIENTVVVFGSARFRSDEESAALVAAAEAEGDAALIARARALARNSHYYEKARAFGKLVAGYSAGKDPDDMLFICTGGGPGIMQAANRGAYEADGISVGLAIALPMEEEANPYVTPALSFKFHYFAIRKMHFMMRAKALVAFPGGFGTLDELFEVITLVQTKKAKPVPIVLFGSDYWKQLINFEFLAEEGVISPNDVKLIEYVDAPQDAWDYIKTFYKL